MSAAVKPLVVCNHPLNATCETCAWTIKIYTYPAAVRRGDTAA